MCNFLKTFITSVDNSHNSGKLQGMKMVVVTTMIMTTTTMTTMTMMTTTTRHHFISLMLLFFSGFCPQIHILSSFSDYF